MSQLTLFGRADPTAGGISSDGPFPENLHQTSPEGTSQASSRKSPGRGPLIRRIRHLADEVLPARARGTGSRDAESPDVQQSGRSGPQANGYPVEKDHCFRRIAYDAALGRQWDTAVSRPFENNATEAQLRRALEVLAEMTRSARRAQELNRRSLRYRSRR